MKKLIFSLVAIMMVQIAFGQTAEEIVKKHIEAIGGETNWKKVNTLIMEASMKANGAEIKLTRTQVHKKAMRMDIDVMGMNGYQIVTEKEGWSFMPFQGQTKPEPMTSDDVKSSQDELSLIDEFITYKEEGKKLEYLGKDDLEGTDCFKLKLTDKEGKEVTYWLDASNYYTLKQSQKVKANGQEMESTTTFSNYKMTPEGILYPYSVGGDWGESEITTLTFNSKIDESLFKPAN